MRIAAVLVAAQLVIRTWVAARGNFYWDDVVLVSRAGTMPLLSSKFLLFDHAGHLMPGAYIVAGIATRLAPLEWGLPIASLVIMQALASLAMLRLLRLLLGWRPALLVPLAIFLFSPLTLPSYAWWAAALNALPLQAGMAWVVGDAIRYYRTGRTRYVVSGTVVLAVTLTFFEKALMVPFVAFAAVALSLRVAGEPAPIATTARRGAKLWLWSGLVVAGWGWLYISTIGSYLANSAGSAGSAGPGRSLDIVVRTVSDGLLPALLGGPWSWTRLGVSSPWATPPQVLVVLGWIGVVAVVGVTMLRKRRVGAVWLLAGTYIAADLAVMVLGRSSDLTPIVLGQTLRYVADSVVVIAIAVALVLRAPTRAPKRATTVVRRQYHRQLVTMAVAVGFFVSCLVSTVTFTSIWADNPTGGYLARARVALAQNANQPMLDEAVPAQVLFAVSYPYNLASHVFASLPDRPDFVTTTPVLRTIDDAGEVVDAVVAGRSIAPGPVPHCGYPMTTGLRVSLPLDHPVDFGDWTVQLNYIASQPGHLQVSFATGPAVTVPLAAGLHPVYLRLVGGGGHVDVTQTSPARDLCVYSGTVGLVLPGPHPGVP